MLLSACTAKSMFSHVAVLCHMRLPGEALFEGNKFFVNGNMNSRRLDICLCHARYVFLIQEMSINTSLCISFMQMKLCWCALNSVGGARLINLCKAKLYGSVPSLRKRNVRKFICQKHIYLRSVELVYAREIGVFSNMDFLWAAKSHLFTPHVLVSLQKILGRYVLIGRICFSAFIRLSRPSYL